MLFLNYIQYYFAYQSKNINNLSHIIIFNMIKTHSMFNQQAFIW